MTTKLKNLYKVLIQKGGYKIQNWHDDYRNFFIEVNAKRQAILSGDHSWKQDEDFLWTLLYKQNNRIAHRGLSQFTKDDFQSFIKNKKFMSALGTLIANPIKLNHEKFSKVWKEQGRLNNIVIINRVTAACTLEVSTTVDEAKFNQVFNWVIQEKLIPEYSSVEDQGWFAKNQFLLNKFQREFQTELKKKITDEFYLDVFVWCLYLYSNELHSKINKSLDIEAPEYETPPQPDNITNFPFIYNK